MRVFCKGFNLYGQLNVPNVKCVTEFDPSLKLEFPSERLKLGHTFSVVHNERFLRIICSDIDYETLEHKFAGDIKEVAINDRSLIVLDNAGLLHKISIEDWQASIVPKFVEEGDKITRISSNSKLNVAYTEMGFLYSIPEKLPFKNRNIVDMKAGKEHCVLLDNTGNVYVFGSGSRGQLGTGQLDDQVQPVLLEALAGITICKIATGGWHSAAISQDGDLYMWGWNGNGQLGLSQKDEDIEGLVSVMATPNVIDIDIHKNVTDVACGSKHTIVLLDNREVYGCGWNKYRQLKSDDKENYFSFVPLHDFSKEKVQKLLCGPWSSAIICK